ncbi:hypothetical protein HHI36_023539 [Cryptolaemus montrouzieri]|uniref:Uncharacterized protein n=1 Tax=Cryptolaemus montrouzieri TaxID=559131 RepID=A0ABD2PGP0_9CUCU
MTPEVPPTNANAYGYAFSGGWPDVFPDNSFLGGGAMPIGEFLSNLRKQQENFESVDTFVFSFSSSSGTSKSQAQSSITFDRDGNSNILNWASDAMARGGPFPPEIPKNLQRDAEGVYAGGIIGPSGVYQTAKLFPENPVSV